MILLISIFALNTDNKYNFVTGVCKRSHLERAIIYLTSHTRGGIYFYDTQQAPLVIMKLGVESHQPLVKLILKATGDSERARWPFGMTSPIHTDDTNHWYPENHGEKHSQLQSVQCLMGMDDSHIEAEANSPILQSIYAKAFSLMKIFQFLSAFHRRLFPTFQLATIQHWVRQRFDAEQVTTWNNDGLICWCI